ncbi:hypothetical protein QG37_04681 [Candidozyma auris]|nr:hypothetical protein QG37_04681 [[Candida] auris]
MDALSISVGWVWWLLWVEVVEKMVAKMCVLGMSHPRGKHLVKQKREKRQKSTFRKNLKARWI